MNLSVVRLPSQRMETSISLTVHCGHLHQMGISDGSVPSIFTAEFLLRLGRMELSMLVLVCPVYMHFAQTAL